jgi:hypothetical protein
MIGPRYQGTRVPFTPTFEGVFGQSWRVTLPPVGERGKPDFDGTVGGFLVRAPNAHPLWDHYMLSVIHLRPIAGVRPADIRLPGATHEFIIGSLNPEQPLPQTLEAHSDAFRLSLLRPIDVVEQFIAATDAVADEILELSVRAIVDGHISPDQDYRSAWKQSIAATAAHFADGTHSMGRPS